MITEIGLKNFKCFGQAITIPVGRVNLFTGINGRGKSTTLQSLLLMRQSPEHSRTTDQIIFNGNCVELGNFDDVRNSDIPRTEPIELTFTFSSDSNNTVLKYILKENISDDMIAQIEEVQVTGSINSNEYYMEIFPKISQHFIAYNNDRYPLYWRDLLFERMENQGEPFSYINQVVRFSSIHYISADRIGPKDFYMKQSFTEFPNVGRKGEFTANILSKKSGDIVNENLCLASGATNTVLDQTEAWLSKVFDGGRIRVGTTDANIVVLSMNSEDSSKTYKPINIGFGYSYALPIIVSGLIAQPGEIIIVENPEAHLHPYAQSQLTKFLTRVSTIGVQVFIESHSDHILNGLRISVLDKLISKDDINILYFHRNTERFSKILVSDDGSIDHWPDGFFDQMNIDFSRLFGV